ncbi:hypothetical protein WJ69_23160 [Burkholderia ubonensis]|uniref:hypothetical protein n=1 Tax=Burkholderia ubonensis TaxID=101571 RepID=UPI0007533F66|nr:hypothetical protein [Burkholderia ubonensis]KVO05602.1 hypothetical protein WJ69_23160 [Burkholderia ubonensis]
MTNVELLEHIASQGYTELRELPDGTIVGLGRLLFTTALYVDLDAEGWARRYCFERRADAARELATLQSGDDVPTGFIAQRGN